MLADWITIGNDAVIFLADFLRVDSGNVSPVIVIQAVESLLRIGMQTFHTLFIGNKEDDINLKSRQVSEIHVLISISHADTFSTELDVCNLELTLDIGICRREHAMYRIIVHSLTKGIENLRGQLELLNLLDKLIILAGCLKALHIAVDHLDKLILHLTDGLTMQFGHRK